MLRDFNTNNLIVKDLSISGSLTLAPATLTSLTNQLPASASGASMIGGFVHNTDKSSTKYCGLFTEFESTENKVKSIIPLPCNISNFYVSLSGAPGTGKSYTFTVRKNGTNTFLTVNISGSNTTGNITGVASSTSFVAGDQF